MTAPTAAVGPAGSAPAGSGCCRWPTSACGWATSGRCRCCCPTRSRTSPADGKTTALGIVTGVGALVAVLVGPIAGALSDATTARTGRRHTWIAGGALLGLRRAWPCSPGSAP